MTRFLAWADGSVARLDIDERGLGLALRDPDGQVAAVFVDDWKAMHSAYSGVRGYARFVLTDGTMGDAQFARRELAESDSEDEVFIEDLGGGATRKTILKNGGADHGGTTFVVETDGHGMTTRKVTDADGRTSLTVEQLQADGNTHSETQVSRPDGTSVTMSGDKGPDGLGTSTVTEFNQGGVQTSQTVIQEFLQAGEKVYQQETKFPSGETEFHSETSHGDGSRYVEDIKTDPSGQITTHETEYTWPDHKTNTSLNPDGTTTFTSKSTVHDFDQMETHVTESVEVRDPNGHQVGDKATTEVTLHHGEHETQTHVTTVEHPDGSKDVLTTEVDESGTITSQTSDHQEAAPIPIPPRRGMTDRTGEPDPDEGPTDRTEEPDPDEGPTDRTEEPDPDEGPTDRTGEPDPDEGPIDRTEEPDPDEGPIDPNEGGFKPKPGRGGIDLTGQPCDPTSGDPFCSAILLKARTNSRGAVGDEVDTLHSFFLLSQGGSGPDDPATTIVRLAQDLFGASETARERRGSPLVMEVQSGVRGADHSWDQLDQPILLVGSLTQISDRMKNRH